MDEEVFFENEIGPTDEYERLSVFQPNQRVEASGIFVT